MEETWSLIHLLPITIRILLVAILIFTGLGVRLPSSAGAPTFQFASPAFSHGGSIPPAYTCDGSNRAPALQWTGAPTGTRSFVLIMVDPDAPGGTFTHWVLFNIPGSRDRLPGDVQPPQVGISGRNDFGRLGYGGPCPPRGVHRYIFTLYALDTPSLPLGEGALRHQVEQAMRGHVLGQAQLMGRYGRK